MAALTRALGSALRGKSAHALRWESHRQTTQIHVVRHRPVQGRVSSYMMSRLRDFFERYFPERELYVRSQGSMRYVTLSPRIQVLSIILVFLLIGWAIVAAVAALTSDRGVTTFDAALSKATQEYQERAKWLEDQNARMRAELKDSEQRLIEVLNQMRSSAGGRTSDTKIIDTIQARLEASRRRLDSVTGQRDDALRRLDDFSRQARQLEQRLTEARKTAQERQVSLQDFVKTLDKTSNERDAANREINTLTKQVAALEKSITEIRQHQEQVLSQLQEATKASLGRLERILRTTGINIDSLIKEIERTYRGVGGPFVPILYRIPEAAKDFPLTEANVNGVLDALQRADSIRIALERLPLQVPIKDTFRYSSPFGPRRHPVTGRWAMHAGLDLAAVTGTKVYAPATGKVIYAARRGSFGKLVEIRHSFGYRTRYAHLNEILVKRGDVVKPGDLIGKVGSTGRSTGPHLHYEILYGKKPLNPWKFIKAGKDVF